LFLQTSIDDNLRLSVELQVADFSRPIVCQVDTGYDGEILIRCIDLFRALLDPSKPKPLLRYTGPVRQLSGPELKSYIIRRDLIFGDNGKLVSLFQILAEEVPDKWDGFDALLGMRFLHRYRMLLELQSDIFELTSTKSTDTELSASRFAISTGLPITS